jgi:hypothetical protein
MHDDEADDALERRFEGAAVLDPLLQRAGSLADTEDVAEAFRQAHAAGAPAAVVIDALWDEEPRFESPDVARRLFSNLLALSDLVASGTPVDVKATVPQVTKRQKAQVPPAIEVPDEAWVAHAMAYLDDWPKERRRLTDAFANRFDAVDTWLEAKGLPDHVAGLLLRLAADIYALAALSGATPGRWAAPTDQTPPAPQAVISMVLEIAHEVATDDGAPWAEAEWQQSSGLIAQLAGAVWSAR